MGEAPPEREKGRGGQGKGWGKGKGKGYPPERKSWLRATALVHSNNSNIKFIWNTDGQHSYHGNNVCNRDDRWFLSYVFYGIL